MPKMALVLTGESAAAAHVEQGDVYYFAGNYDRALEEYGEAIRLNPQYAIAYRTRRNQPYRGDTENQSHRERSARWDWFKIEVLEDFYADSGPLSGPP
jgi:tetratricopeptide (TPR) repeat protein